MKTIALGIIVAGLLLGSVHEPESPDPVVGSATELDAWRSGDPRLGSMPIFDPTASGVDYKLIVDHPRDDLDEGIVWHWPGYPLSVASDGSVRTLDRD